MTASAMPAAVDAVRGSPTRPRVTFEEYLASDYEHGLAEWVDGEVVIAMSVTEPHQRVAQFLLALLRAFVRLRRLGRVIGAPYAMRAAPGGNAREPDVMFVSGDHLDRLGRTHLAGPADLVVEVISEDSAARDRDDKFSEYQDAGVGEYWIIDPRPNRRRADFYVLSDQGRYQPVPIPADNRYHSSVLPGFWLDLGWLWLDDPDELEALEQVAGVERVSLPQVAPDSERR